MDFRRRAMVEVFKKKARPTMFLSSMFQSPESNKKDTLEVVIDIKRNGEHIAIDIVRKIQMESHIIGQSLNTMCM